jgi:integrase
LLLQHFGDGHPLSAIGPKQIGELFDLLEQVPRNAQQRYPKKSLQEAVVAADKKKDPDRLAKKTLTNYHRNIIAMFNYGKAMGMVGENPAASPIHRDRFKGKREKKELFDTATLNQLFQAPLYKGCQNDAEGYAKQGPNVIRRGRFWVPLLGLYQGFRCNEACQLHTADIKQEDGVWYIWVREEADQKMETDKSVKNVNSERPVPIHKELIRFGFLDFVADRAKDKKGPNLFPELPCSAKGYRSDLFSKWFGRFKDKVAKDCPATFHSFRHHWRTALRRANVSTEDAEELGGWSSGSRSSEHTYNHGKTLLALKAVIDLVEYPGLDLSHLAPQTERQVPLKVYPRRSRVSV